MVTRSTSGRGVGLVLVGAVVAGLMALVTLGAFVWGWDSGDRWGTWLVWEAEHGGARILVAYALLLLGFFGSRWIVGRGLGSLGADSIVLRWGLAVVIVLVGAVGAIEIAYATGFAGEGSSNS